jgi:3-oxoacyl-[acyl-carrier-protein] synthase-3
MRNIGIIGTGSYVPNVTLTNRDLEKRIDTSDEWIYTKTGIKARRIADDSEATSDLALYASLEALRDAEIAATDVDLIVLATSTPDMIQPSTAAILQGKLGAINAVSFDVGAVCAGFVYAMTVAVGLMKAYPQYRRVLVVGAETYSRILDWTDRTTCVFFGDGAGAVVLSDVEDGYGYLSHYLMNDGRGWDVIKFTAGGSRFPTSQETINKGLHAFRMQGKKVWDFAVRVLPDAVKKALALADMSVSDIDLLISHQANINIIRHGLRELGLDGSRTYTTIEKYGNTSGASIPITLAEAQRAEAVRPNSILVLVGFGGGLSWGAMVLRWGR